MAKVKAPQFVIEAVKTLQVAGVDPAAIGHARATLTSKGHDEAVSWISHNLLDYKKGLEVGFEVEGEKPKTAKKPESLEPVKPGEVEPVKPPVDPRIDEPLPPVPMEPPKKKP